MDILGFTGTNETLTNTPIFTVPAAPENLQLTITSLQVGGTGQGAYTAGADFTIDIDPGEYDAQALTDAINSKCKTALAALSPAGPPINIIDLAYPIGITQQTGKNNDGKHDAVILRGLFDYADPNNGWTHLQVCSNRSRRRSRFPDREGSVSQ